MKKTVLIIAALAIGLNSCEKEESEGRVKNDPEFAQELMSSPETVTIGNNNLVLETYIWRDFMPVRGGNDGDGNGSGMFCVSKLTEVDGAPILSTIELIKHYVIKGDEIWTADYVEVRKDRDHILEGVVKEGPKWGPDIEVDVVIEFENSGTTYRILAASQRIGRTA